MRISTSFPRSLLLFAALLVALPGCGQSKQAGGPPQAGEPEVTVVTIKPETVTLTTVLAGRTSAYQVSDVRPQVGGIIQKRLFKEGSEVKLGEVLYQIDPATYQAAYDNAKATLAKAEANAVPARLKGDRYGNLTKVNAVSQQDNDDAQAAKRQTEADVIAAKAALETARINLSYTRVTSPISGRIGKSSVTPGALVTASQATALATVQQTDPMYVDVTQSSSEVLRMKRDLASGKLKKTGTGGAKVKLLFEDGTPYGTEGSLQFSDITVDQTTGVITLRALFPNARQELMPGLYVRAVLEEGVEENAIVVPQAAVSRDSRGLAQVMVVKADGVVEVRQISVVRVVGDKWLVSEGLAAGDRVIVDGLQKVKPGGKAKAVEAGQAAPAAPAGQAGQAANATAQAPAPEAAQQPAAKPEAAKPEAAKPEAAPKADAAPKAAKPAATASPAPVAAKAEKPQTSVPAEKAAPARAGMKEVMKEVMKDEPKGKVPTDKRSIVYSPPKDQPWPGSVGASASDQKSEPTPAQ
ncbi:MAG TPA: efflux RND transporter periplasmic adaptor subunit [Humidesulfovibrio sp.]|uniref:efflux RND transporter periplasmic adaptor subunit n=1 Tax=Humidesulfovibrio sp. TaxID=2910988 RepID=UPI002B890977|nr:efflux RND transporter periplasmic adaptor subunit [Humidesulfovibrio sp.]HWR04412.1 efflux RND transporter periplasmic adaptor subunit [Humidesulfovibrio sp.]